MQKIYDVKNYVDVLPEISVEESSQKINLVSIGKCENSLNFSAPHILRQIIFFFQ